MYWQTVEGHMDERTPNSQSHLHGCKIKMVIGIKADKDPITTHISVMGNYKLIFGYGTVFIGVTRCSLDIVLPNTT